MAKPTDRQSKILQAMREGSSLTLIHGINPSAYLWPTPNGLRVRADDPYHMERKGLIEQESREWNFTKYRIAEAK